VLPKNSAFHADRTEIQDLVVNRACEIAEIMKLEDLAYISEVCRFEGIISLATRQKFVAAIKPLVIESWESKDFQTKEAAVSIAVKLTIAVAQVQKYQKSNPPGEQDELWSCVLSMLKWSL